MRRIKEKDLFYAVVRKGPCSRTLAGVERADIALGPFIAAEIGTHEVATYNRERVFRFADFKITKGLQ